MAEKIDQNDLDPLDRNPDDDLVGQTNDDEFQDMEDLDEEEEESDISEK